MPNRIEIEIIAKDLATQVLTRIGEKLGGIQDIAAASAIAGVGIAYVDFLKSTIEPAAEAETAQVRLAAAMRATGRDSEISALQLADIATQLMKVSTFDDESIKKAFQVLSQFPSIPTSAFEDLTKAAMDLSAAMGGDLATNAEAIGRALESGLIPRTWGFSAALKEQFKAQVDAGDSAGALATMMDALNQRYSGQAAAEVGTYAGQVKQLDNNWSEFKEGIGGQFIPALSGLLGWVNQNFEAITNWTTALYNLMVPAQAIANIIDGIVSGGAGGIGNYEGGPVYVPPGGAANAPSGGLPVATGGNYGAGFYARGGFAAGGSAWVGEMGPEMVSLPRGSYVHTAGESSRMGGGFTFVYSPMFSMGNRAEAEMVMAPIVQDAVRRMKSAGSI